jgi:two-component system response regulator RegA
VVDDDRPFCAALAAALRRRGFEVVVAYGYRDALSEAEAWAPRRAVVDLRMPGRDGLELVAALKGLLPEIEIVVLTGYGSIATAVQAIKLGACHYLTKPATADEILKSFETDAGVEAGAVPQTMPLGDVEREHIEQVLVDVGGNVSEAARRLGVHRRTLQRKLARKRTQRD